MNKTDVVTKVSQKTGISADICEKAIKIFEEQFGSVLIGKLKGVKDNRADILKSISEKTNIASEDCEKILAAFENVVGTGLSDKLKFLK